MKRIQFTRQLLSAIAGIVLLVTFISCNPEPEKISFAVCADVHRDIMHDTEDRLKEFVEAATDFHADFIIHLGDFCCPYEKNQSFLDIWNSFEGEKYHVMGNHDTDGGFTKQETIDFWNSKGQYYSFDNNNFHLVVLSGNDVNPAKEKSSGYPFYIGKKQQEWLEQDLRSTDKKVIIFSHQPLETKEGIENSEEIMNILNAANEEAGFTKVIACFSGHFHSDYYKKINGIYFIQINSMSYQWLGKRNESPGYSKETYAQFPNLLYTAPYKDPVYGLVTIDERSIHIEGRKTEFVGLTPEELGITNENTPMPSVSDRDLLLAE